jgi:hypothetical protein
MTNDEFINQPNVGLAMNAMDMDLILVGGGVRLRGSYDSRDPSSVYTFSLSAFCGVGGAKWGEGRGEVHRLTSFKYIYI